MRGDLTQIEQITCQVTDNYTRPVFLVSCILKSNHQYDITPRESHDTHVLNVNCHKRYTSKYNNEIGLVHMLRQWIGRSIHEIL